MFDFHRWADWASQQVIYLRAQGFDSQFTFAEECRSSDNLAFFVDLDSDQTVGRIIVWSTGDFQLEAIQKSSDEPTRISDLPAKVTDDNFQTILGRFIELVRV